MIIVLASGGFDPITDAHIDYLNGAKKLGDRLIVLLNSDRWLARKKGRPFMDFQTRKKILSNIKPVDYVVDVDDEDGTVISGIKNTVRWAYPDDKIIFCNGGDRTKDNIPEMNVDYGFPVEFQFGVGGNKKTNSSSWLLERWVKNANIQTVHKRE